MNIVDHLALMFTHTHAHIYTHIRETENERMEEKTAIPESGEREKQQEKKTEERKAYDITACKSRSIAFTARKSTRSE